MAELLIEIFSEEIPARMQSGAAKDLERLVRTALSEAGLTHDGAKALAGSRRLALCVSGLPAKQPDVREERKGPRVNAPEKAIEGFLRSAGVTLDQCQTQDDGKGAFYVAVIERTGRATADVLADILPEAFAKLPWPKSMRFPGSALRWVRPLHSVIALFDGAVVPFEFCGVASGQATRGHRFLSQGEIVVKNFADYQAKLMEAHVVVDGEKRKAIILNDARQKAAAIGCEMIDDVGLLEEVSGLAEWPNVLIGTIEDQFMDVPPEILQTSMRTHQKYFSVRDASGRMANKFVVVSNMVAADGGAAIVAGNERVLRARLSDAKFFWDLDRKERLDSRIAALKGITFHAKLGTQYERVQRIVALAGEIAGKIGEDVEKAKRAALLCKADLTTGVVGEFPELQGIMGGYYAAHDGEDAEVASAIRDHYKPLGPTDTVPTEKVAIAVALADKLDQLTGFFAADEKPTGSADPFALRRAALGVIRILLDNGLRLPLAASDEVIAFFADRLKVALKEKGVRHDLIDAVFSLGGEDDLVRLVARVEALQSFIASDTGKNLLAAYKRAANILKAEEKKDKTSFGGTVETTLLNLPEEQELGVDLMAVARTVKVELQNERFVEAMRAMARLRAPVDAFFDKVTVNDPKPELRVNRLKLLASLRATLHLVADFSKIEG